MGWLEQKYWCLLSHIFGTFSKIMEFLACVCAMTMKLQLKTSFKLCLDIKTFQSLQNHNFLMESLPITVDFLCSSLLLCEVWSLGGQLQYHLRVGGKCGISGPLPYVLKQTCLWTESRARESALQWSVASRSAAWAAFVTNGIHQALPKPTESGTPAIHVLSSSPESDRVKFAAPMRHFVTS